MPFLAMSTAVRALAGYWSAGSDGVGNDAAVLSPDLPPLIENIPAYRNRAR